MAIHLTVNSYVTLAEAEEYFEHRLDVAAWEDATPEQKEASLLTAADMMNNMNWIGVATTDDMAWPRQCQYFDPKYGRIIYDDGTSVPERIVKTQLELAYHLLNNDGLLDSTGKMRRIKVGSIEIDGMEMTDTYNKVAKSYYSILLRDSLPGANSWWRNN